MRQYRLRKGRLHAETDRGQGVHYRPEVAGAVGHQEVVVERCQAVGVHIPIETNTAQKMS